MPRRLPPPLLAAIAEAEAGDTRPRARRIELVLPFPISVNHLYRSWVAGKRVMVGLSSEGQAYKDAVAKTIQVYMSGRRPPAPYYTVTIRAYPPDRRKHDLDNLLKIVSDSLFAAIRGDDNDVIDLHITKPRPDEKPAAWPRIVVVLEGEGDV